MAAVKRHGTVTLRWGDGEHDFRLALGNLRELQDKTGAGPMELLRRLSDGRWRVDDVRETLRVGLLGGGAKPAEASKLVERYVDERPRAESVPVAQAVLMFTLYGDPDDKVVVAGESGRRGSQSGQMDGSPSPQSTEQVQQ